MAGCHFYDLFGDPLEAPVVVLVCADPFPKKTAVDEFADGAVTGPHSHGPVRFANGFEVEGGVECVC